MTDAARSITIVLPYLPPASYSANSRTHWTAKRGKRGANRDVLDDVRILLAEQNWRCRYTGLLRHGDCQHRPPLERAKISVCFGLPDKRRRDPGGLQERAKSCFDSLVRLGVLADDSLGVIGWPEYSHHYSPKQPSTTIRIEEVLK